MLDGVTIGSGAWSLSRRSIRYLQHPPRKTPSVNPEWCVEAGRHATSEMRSTAELQARYADLTGFEPATSRLQVEVSEIFSTRFDTPTGNKRQRLIIAEVSAVFTTIGNTTIPGSHCHVNSKRKLFRAQCIGVYFPATGVPPVPECLDSSLTMKSSISSLGISRANKKSLTPRRSLST